MAHTPKFHYLVIFTLLILALTGCEMRRDSSADLDTVGQTITPTLASLGVESAVPAGQATPIPTVITVKSTGTPSLMGAGQAAENPAEPVAPTSQPAAIGVTPLAKPVKQIAVITPTVAAETFVPPAQPASTQTTPVVVNAPDTGLPEGGPVAANPPAGQSDTLDADAAHGSTYVVQAGDTLFSIGLRYDTTVEALMRINNLTSDMIYVGQVLRVPGGGGGYRPAPGYDQPPTGNNGYHVVAAGDTLFSIAMRYGTSVDAMAAANQLAYPFTIYADQTLTIPGYGGGQPPFEGGYEQPQAPASGRTHIVAPGETLYSIAVRYGTTPRALVALNGLVNPNQIYVGQVLYLP